MKLKLNLFAICFLGLFYNTFGQASGLAYKEPYRPQFHFSPKAHWTNDPNGMVYYKGTYHLFFQYYPKATVWGPMHWGHATSTDLVHWKELPIALYPDKLGYIFSGSAVADIHNTSGFGKNGKIPLVAIFTHHDPAGEKAATNKFQNESLAYSLDDGNTWTKYAANPVLKNPGIKDFRDPKVSWYEPLHEWFMTLATKDRITFFSSPNLKDWKKESEFGSERGAHGGVWECPDLFQLTLNGKKHWVLLVSINPGGPNGGSLTQYFIGKFDGHSFTSDQKQTKWVDYGPDNYAGVTWGNTGDRKIFLGWMSNWTYANQVPTEKWRNAMTIPRELALKEVNGDIFITSKPVTELQKIASSPVSIDLKSKIGVPQQFMLSFDLGKLSGYTAELSNTLGEKLVIGYDQSSKRYFIDRSKSGVTSFNKDFVRGLYAPRLSTASVSNLTIVVDAASIEMFADNGLTLMTATFFPKKPYDHLEIKNANGLKITHATLKSLKSIW